MNDTLERVTDSDVEEKEVIYTDGSCLDQADKTRRCAGFAVFFGIGDPRNTSRPIEGVKHTNNVGELTAVVEALERSSETKKVVVVTDSKYVIGGLVGNDGDDPWHHRWEQNGWKNSKGKPVENQELWKRLIAISKKRDFSMRWQRGHSGNFGNERANTMAQQGASLAKKKRLLKLLKK